jgi:hypothetical protein
MKNVERLNIPQRAELLKKAAQEMNVVLVEKEPDFQEKAFLPHTNISVARLEDWYYQQMNHALEGLKQRLVREISGKQIKNKGVVGRTRFEDAGIRKSLSELLHFRDILSNPGVTKITRNMLYQRAREMMTQTSPEKRGELIDVFMEIRDLVG